MTKETDVAVSIRMDGSGKTDIRTGVELLDRMLTIMAAAGSFDLSVRAKGDLETGDHHTVEDVGITLGDAISGLGLQGSGSSAVAWGESLGEAAVSFGRPGYVGSFSFAASTSGGMALQNFGHLLRTLAYHGGFSLHLQGAGGMDADLIESMMRALGRAIHDAYQDGTSKEKPPLR